MKPQRNVRIILLVIALFAITSIGLKLSPILRSYDNFSPEVAYKVTYDYFFKTGDKETTVKTFIPVENSKQRISQEKVIMDNTLSFTKDTLANGNVKGIWKPRLQNEYHAVKYEFLYEGKERKYTIPSTFKAISDTNKTALSSYLSPTENIQSDHIKIESLALTLKSNAPSDKKIIKNVFDYVSEIPSAPIITLTDAITTIEQNRASCNGKSRLFVAICRNLGYPARIKGGIILENTNKRTSHVWAEVLINEEWIPFDALNNHFAYLPANYMEIYAGDEFLITHTANIQFDYTYTMEAINFVSFVNMSSEEISAMPGVSLWGLIESGVLPKKALNLMLLLPLGGLLVAFLRNVVGVKTFGVFLPVLIAFSLLHTGFVLGMIVFVVLIVLVGIISYPFDKLGLLYTPKLVISLTIMVSIIISATLLGTHYNIPWLTTFSFFPIIIVTIASERFVRATIEDGYKMAIDKLSQTLLATAICYAALCWSWLPSVLVIFPEFILLVIVLAALLGRYIGIRWVEFYRFRPLLNNSSIAK